MGIFIEPVLSAYYQKYPLVLVDVGASGGIESHWKSAEKYLQLIGFEPDEREFVNLKRKENPRVKYFNTGLYKEKTSLEYYLTQKQQTSSIFEPNRIFLNRFPEANRFDVIKQIKIEVDTLDNQFTIHHIEDTDFIKVDTQGSELFILAGAVDTIKNHVFGVEVEVEFVEMYQNQPLFSDVDSFMRRQGFWLFDIQSVHWKRNIGKNYHKKRGQIIFGNVLYLRTLESFCKMTEVIQEEAEKKSKILKAFSICFLYGYFDYAMEIFDGMKTLFNDTERRAIEKKIQGSTRLENRIPNFLGRGKMASMVFALSEILRPTHNGWAIIDRKLGNV